jgi:hypothetical protein
VTSTGQNLRLHPETGLVIATEGSITGPAGATITGAAYTNNTAGASTTVLYALDPTTDQLYRQAPANDGTLVAVGPLKLNITGGGGFDIDARTGTALALYPVGGNPTLFTVDLATGATRVLAAYASTSLDYAEMAIPTQPVAYAAGFQGLQIFNPLDSSPLVFKKVEGLGPAEVLEALDFRPATGQLYALGRNRDPRAGTIDPIARLYTLDLGTGQVTLVGPVSSPVRGQTLDLDFHPLDDYLRLTTSDRENMRLDPATGRATQEIPLSGDAIPSGAAHATDGTGTSTLYVLDNRGSLLYRADAPPTGLLRAVGSLEEPGSRGVSAKGLDIGNTSHTAYALLTPLPPLGSPVIQVDRMATLNLLTGRATFGRELVVGTGRSFTIGLGF